MVSQQGFGVEEGGEQPKKKKIGKVIKITKISCLTYEIDNYRYKIWKTNNTYIRTRL